MTDALEGVKSDLTLIKISIATQAADLGYIKEKVGKIDQVEERLRTVETTQTEITGEIKRIGTIEDRVRDVELCQAADRTRRNVQDGLAALLAIIAGALGISK